jgi:branched-chain amino acid transport system permease protein
MSATLLLIQLLNGIQFGLILFLIAAGLTLVFGVLHFINLAHGVQYMVGAYLAVTFAALTGSFLLGLLIALPVALALGLAFEFLIFRHLYERHPLDQVLATSGVIIFLNEAVRMIWGVAPRSIDIPDGLAGSIEIADGVLYPIYRLAIIAAGLFVGTFLYVTLNHTRFGMLIRAGASNSPMVAALGVNIRLLFTFVFGFGAMLAGFAGAMVSPILSVEPGMGDNVLIVAFVVIVIGGIGSLRGAFLAALLIGVVDTLGRFLAPLFLRALLAPAAASQTGRAIAPMLIYLLMAAALLIRPGGLFAATTGAPPASTGIASSLPTSLVRAPGPWQLTMFVVFAALAVVPLFARYGAEGYILSLMTRVMALGLAALSLDLLIGFGGLVSFGQAAFVGIGAYAVGILSAEGINDGLVQLAAALVAAALFAVATGAVALRTHGVYLIMITLAFGQMLFFLATSLASYGGDDGMSLSERSHVFGTDVLASSVTLYYVAFASLLAIYLLLRRVVASRFGRVLIGARENAARMAAIGFSAFPYQLIAYMLAAMIAALAGFLLANQSGFVSPATMAWQRSGDLIFMVVLGGLGSLHGAIIGAILFLLSEDFLANYSEHWRIVFGPMLIMAVLFAPGGLAGMLRSPR